MIAQADLPVIEIQAVQRRGGYVTYDVTVNGRPWARYGEYEQAVECSAVLVGVAIRKLEACGKGVRSGIEGSAEKRPG